MDESRRTNCARQARSNFGRRKNLQYSLLHCRHWKCPQKEWLVHSGSASRWWNQFWKFRFGVWEIEHSGIYACSLLFCQNRDEAIEPSREWTLKVVVEARFGRLRFGFWSFCSDTNREKQQIVLLHVSEIWLFCLVSHSTCWLDWSLHSSLTACWLASTLKTNWHWLKWLGWWCFGRFFAWFFLARFSKDCSMCELVRTKARKNAIVLSVPRRSSMFCTREFLFWVLGLREIDALAKTELELFCLKNVRGERRNILSIFHATRPTLNKG